MSEPPEHERHEALATIAHSLCSQEATLRLEASLLDSISDGTRESADNLRRVAENLAKLADRVSALRPQGPPS